MVNIHEAKTHFSKLVDRAARGETIVVARAGRPVARLVPLEQVEPAPRIGFLVGPAQIPDDFDALGADRIADDFDAIGSDRVADDDA